MMEKAHYPLIRREPRLKRLAFSDLVNVGPKINDYLVPPGWLEGVGGKGCLFNQLVEDLPPFVDTMLRAGAIADDDRELTAWQPLRQFRVEQTRGEKALFALRSKGTAEALLAVASELDRAVRALEGLARLLLRVSLDFCAVIGGLEYPRWPLDEGAVGTIFVYEGGVAQLREGLYLESERRLASALGRWGVPHSCVHVPLHPVWLDLSEGSRPTADARAEGEYQDLLRRIDRAFPIARKLRWVCTSENVELLRPNTKDGVISDGEERYLRMMLKIAFNPDSQQPPPFADFSLRLGRILGPIWPIARYEDGLHAFPHPAGATWKALRDFLFQGSTETYAIRLQFNIPIHYSHPELPVPQRRSGLPHLVFRSELPSVPLSNAPLSGVASASVAPAYAVLRVKDATWDGFELRRGASERPAQFVPAPTVPLHTWFGLEVGPVGAEIPLVDLSLSYRRQGALGFLRRKNKGGDQRHHLRMVFKDEAMHGIALGTAEKDGRFSEVTAFSLNEEPQRVRSFRFFAFEAYWRQLYARPRSIWCHERLMKGAPPCLRVPYSPGLEPSRLRELTAQDEQHLLNCELFEVDRYPPLVGEPKDGPVGPLDLDKLSCTRQWLTQFCWKAVPNSLLDDVEALSMLRFELVLSTLCDLRSWSFSHPIYSSDGSPYVKVVRYICKGVRAAFEQGEAGCSWITPRQRTDGPRIEECVAHDRDKGVGRPELWVLLLTVMGVA